LIVSARPYCSYVSPAALAIEHSELLVAANGGMKARIDPQFAAERNPIFAHNKQHRRLLSSEDLDQLTQS
jgi:hypothetical protein